MPGDYGLRTLGEGVAVWMHKWLVQPNGPRAGLPFRLTRRQYRFLLWFYAVNDDGSWVFGGAVRRLAKGSGKSPMAAAISLAEFVGPVRLERFDDRAPGGCRGKRVLMPWVQITATAESQTINTMRMVRALAPKKSKIVAEFGLDPGKTIYYCPPEGMLQVTTSSFTAVEGAEPTFVVGDETEHWKPANGGVELSSTIEDNLAKSGARALKTCNAWIPGTECVAEGDWDDWVAQEEGTTQRDALVLYDAVIAPPETELGDPVSLQAALEMVYDDCDWKRPHDEHGNPDWSKPVDIRPILGKIWKLTSKPGESKRKYLNRPEVAEDAWTTPEAWALLTDRERIVTRDEPVVLFFDGSKSRDATALIGCCMSDGHVFCVDVWEPDTAHTTEDVVNVVEVDARVTESFERRYNVVGFFGDVQEWESFVKIDWPNRYAEQLQIMAVPGGKDPQSIAWDMRGHNYEFTQQVELVEAEINERLFTHDGDPRLARHVANMRRRPNRYGVSIGKESPSSPKKIDAGVCMIGARMVRRLVLAAEPKKKRTGAVWGY